MQRTGKQQRIWIPARDSGSILDWSVDWCAVMGESFDCTIVFLKVSQACLILSILCEFRSGFALYKILLYIPQIQSGKVSLWGRMGHRWILILKRELHKHPVFFHMSFLNVPWFCYLPDLIKLILKPLSAAFFRCSLDLCWHCSTDKHSQRTHRNVKVSNWDDQRVVFVVCVLLKENLQSACGIQAAAKPKRPGGGGGFRIWPL